MKHPHSRVNKRNSKATDRTRGGVRKFSLPVDANHIEIIRHDTAPKQSSNFSMKILLLRLSYSDCQTSLIGVGSTITVISDSDDFSFGGGNSNKALFAAVVLKEGFSLFEVGKGHGSGVGNFDSCTRHGIHHSFNDERIFTFNNKGFKFTIYVLFGSKSKLTVFGPLPIYGGIHRTY
jgi:hypothetical protein